MPGKDLFHSIATPDSDAYRLVEFPELPHLYQNEFTVVREPVGKA